MFSPQNVIGTLLLSFCVLYWFIVIVGIIDLDLFDFELEVDLDVDVDSDVDVSATDGSVAWLNKILVFFNLGKIPFMVWLTFLSFPLWFLLMIVNNLFGNTSFFISIVFFIPLLIISAFIAKPLTYPFVKIFAALDKENKPKDLIGKMGRVVLTGNHERKGQVEVNYEGSSIRVYVWPSSKDIKLKKNESVLIIQKSETEDQVYIVEPYDNN
jgi:membrane protein implicated in regulation of membrane protease activity